MKKFDLLGKSLSKGEQKTVLGGVADGSVGGCSMTYQDSGGVWHTEQGSCSEATGPNGFGNTIHTPYCRTANFTGPTELSSNGGQSRCGNQYVTFF